jgi:high-affinity nickel-transport protein
LVRRFRAVRANRSDQAQDQQAEHEEEEDDDDGYHVHVTTFGSVQRHTHMVAVDESGNVVPAADEGATGEVDGPGGVFARCCPKLFGAVDTPFKMYPIGFLFGLGFDTASEVALLGLTAMGSSTSTYGAIPAWAIMVLPCLFAAGMSLIDTLDGMMMMWAYSWAQLDPARRIFFNLFLTCVSAFIALVVAVVEILGLLQAQLDLTGSWFWDSIASINDNFEYVGYSILGFFAASCLVAAAAFKCCLSDGSDGGGIQPADPEAEAKQAAEQEAAAKQVAAQRDDYLRKRMLGLARGGSVRPVEI